jgi:two-component system NtrC family sensor kinase
MLTAVKRKVATSLRYKLLVLVLFPMLVIAFLTVGIVVFWSQDFSNNQLLRRVHTDLNVAHASFVRLQRDYLNHLERLAGSHAFYTAFANGDAERIQEQLAVMRLTTGFDFVQVTDLHGRWIMTEQPASGGTSKLGPLHRNVVAWGTPGVDIEIYSTAELENENPELLEQARVAIIETSHATTSDRSIEDRALVIRAIAPVRDPNGTLVALVDGGVVLNNSFGLVDSIRNLVYGPDSLPEGSFGTVTVFLDDVRISTNVPAGRGKRAVGTRVSEAVRRSVLEQGNTWVDYAFVVDDWYISAYEPIVDAYGQRVGMLHTGFPEAPFRHAYYRTLGGALVFLLLGMLVASLVVVRGAAVIFQPIESIAAVVRDIRKGKDRRVGNLAKDDEIGELARQFDATLNLLTLRNDEIRQAAERLESKVDERTGELKQQNQRLEETIAQLEAARQQLVSAEKLAALGELTAGVAHEINNPIAVIQGNLDVLRFELGDDIGRVQVEVDLILEQVARIHAIVDKLLRYSRPSEYGTELQEVEPNRLIDETLVLVEHEVDGKSLDVQTDYRAATRITIDPQELQQVLVNLLVNAVHASHSGGLITVGTRDFDGDGGTGVVISVRDRGIGISAEQLPRIFDPFFTTKRVGGTGLGLSVSYGLLRRYGGDIKVTSEPGQGSTFEVFVPASPVFLGEGIRPARAARERPEAELVSSRRH